MKLFKFREGSNDMEHLSDELLLESFYEANKLNLSPDFISLIIDEINRRNLNDEIEKYKQ